MKLLKIEHSCGYFINSAGEYNTMDKINKEDLLSLVELVLEEDDVVLDEYDDSLIKNQAHQIIYKSICRKLKSLRDRRKEFVDESARLFLEDYERYREKKADETETA